MSPTPLSAVGSALGAAAPTQYPTWGGAGFGGMRGAPQYAPEVVDEARDTRKDGETVQQSLERVEQEQARGSVRELLISAGIDPDSPATQLLLSTFGQTDQERWDFLQTPEGRSYLLGAAANPDMALPVSSYQQTLQAAGFDEGDVPVKATKPDISERTHQALAQMQAFTQQKGPAVRYNEDTGWTVFGNGTLVSPDGQITFDPASTAPGSQRWLIDIQGSWTEAEVSSWRAKLVDMGYLSKEAKKARGFSQDFLQALQAYHLNRYVNGGKPIAATGGAGAGGRFAGQPLFDYNDIEHQVKNSVASQLEQFYGVVPEEEEVRRWTNFVIGQASSLQKKFRRDEVSSYTSAAYGEAEETFIDQIRQDTAGYREDLEENTKLRDSLRNAAAAASALA